MIDQDPGKTCKTVAKVICVTSEFNQVLLRDKDGYEYAITRHLPGFDISNFEEDQMWDLTVEDDLRRVLNAKLIP